MRKFLFITLIISTFNASADGLDSCSVHYNLRDSVVIQAQKYLGVNYKYGGTSPKSGFDCSGFVMYVFKKFGVQLPRTSRSMASIGKEKDKSQAQIGDIILFKGRNSSSVGHVGIVYNTPSDELIFIHSSSPRSGGVIFSSLEESYYKKRFVKIVDVLA